MDTNIFLENKTINLLFFLKLAKNISGKTKLNKIIFLGKQEEDIDLGFHFEKYNYGPYSFDLTESLNKLEDNEFIEIEMEVLPSSDINGFQSKQFTYKISSKGNDFLSTSASDIMKNLQTKEKIKQLLKKWNNLSRTKIVEHVYSKYM